MRRTSPNRRAFLMLSSRVVRLLRRRKGRDVTLDSSKGSRGRQAGSVLTHHQHKHTEEGWRERGEEGGGGGGRRGCYIRHHNPPAARPTDQLDKGQ